MRRVRQRTVVWTQVDSSTPCVRNLQAARSVRVRAGRNTITRALQRASPKWSTRGAKSSMSRAKASAPQSICGWRWMSAMALEGLYVPVPAPCVADFRAELSSFPAGRHDDESMRSASRGVVGRFVSGAVRHQARVRGEPRTRNPGRSKHVFAGAARVSKPACAPQAAFLVLLSPSRTG